MTTFYQTKTQWLLLLLLFFINFAYAQPCDNGTNQYPFGTVSGPASSGTSITVDLCNYAGEYALITGIVANETYTFTSAGDYITIRNANSNAVLASGSSPVSFTPNNAQDIEMHLNLDDGACGTDASCHAVTMTWGATSTACEASVLTTSTPVTVCGGPDGTFTVAFDNNVQVPTGGGVGFNFTPGTGATGGSVAPPGADGFAINIDPSELSQTWNNDINGVLSSNSAFPMLGQWIVEGFIVDPNDPPNTACDTS